MIDEIRDVERQARELYEHPFRANAACHEARLAASLIRSELLFVQMERVPTGLHLRLDVDELDHQLEGQLDLVEQFYLGDQQQVREARTLTGRWRERRIALMRLLDAGQYEDARALTLNEISPLHDAVMQRLDALTDFTRLKGAFYAEEAHRKAAESVQRMWTLLALLVLGTLVGASGVTMLVVGQLRRRDRELAHERERIRLLADNVPGLATVLLDTQGRVQSWNEGARRLHGYDAAEIVGQPIERLYTPDQAASGKTARVLALAQANGFHEDLDWRVRKDGSRLFADVIVCPLRDENGLLMGFLKISRDISERHRLEQDLIAARDRAEAASRAKSGFLANMSHEVRTPLNAIIGLTQLVLDSPLKPEQRDFLGKVQRSSRALLGVLNDLLDYSKIEAGHLEFESIDMSVEDVLRQTADLFMASIEHKGLEIFVEVDPALPRTVRGDPLRLAQVLNNLVGNAVKFTQHGEIRLRVDCLGQIAATPASSTDATTPATAPQVELRFHVSDTGIGIAPHSVDLLFQAFAQADESVTRKYGGTGLGLAICRNLVSLMGGQISVQSEPDQGSSFTFTARFEQRPDCALGLGPERDGLPEPRRVLVIDDQGSAAAPARTEGDSAEATPSRPQTPGNTWRQAAAAIVGRRILLVEDNELSQTVAREFLHRAGLDVICAGSGGEALAAVETEVIDAVLMDLHMPDMDGFEATRRIRALPGRRELPIIALTAAALQSDRAAAYAAGMNAHLAKPIDPQTLIELLTQWLDPRGRDGNATQTHAPDSPPADTVDDQASTRPDAAGRPTEPGPDMGSNPQGIHRSGRPERQAARLDRAEALARMGGDARVLAKLLKRFMDSHRDSARVVRDALLRGEPVAAIAMLHRLAGAAASLGLTDLGRSASVFEVSLRAPDALGATPDLDQLNAELSEQLRQAGALVDAELTLHPARLTRLVLRPNGELQEGVNGAASAEHQADTAVGQQPQDELHGQWTAPGTSGSSTRTAPRFSSHAHDIETPPGKLDGLDAAPALPIAALQRADSAGAGKADAIDLATQADPQRAQRRASARRLLNALEALQPLLRERDLVPHELLDGLERHTEAWAVTLDPRAPAGAAGAMADAADVVETLAVLGEQLDAYDYPQAETALQRALQQMRILHA
jgi:PAS domain S-box-containing protein